MSKYETPCGNLQYGYQVVKISMKEKHVTFGICKHDMEWWRSLWEQSQSMTLTDSFAHACHALAWEDWLVCDNPYALGDRDMIKAENSRYFTTHGLIAHKR
jgi:hypothetical protein